MLETGLIVVLIGVDDDILSTFGVEDRQIGEHSLTDLPTVVKSEQQRRMIIICLLVKHGKAAFNDVHEHIPYHVTIFIELIFSQSPHHRWMIRTDRG